MSRSYKHNNFIGMTGDRSEKYDKRVTNKGVRSKSKQIINTSDPDELSQSDLPLRDEVRDKWDFNKDGKMLFEPKDIEDDIEWRNKRFTKEGKLRK